MFLLITKGEIYTATHLLSEDLVSADRGYLTIIDITENGKPKLFSCGLWKSIEHFTD